MRIGVYGSGSGEFVEEIKVKARKVGELIARGGHTLVTGACPGYPHEAVLGAAKGMTEGYSPWKDEEEHLKEGYPTGGFTKIHYTGKGKKMRNIMSVMSCDACVFIAGRIGSLNEFTIAYDEGKHIGILTGTGGMADLVEMLIQKLDKPSKSVVIYESDPEVLIKKLTEQ